MSNITIKKWSILKMSSAQFIESLLFVRYAYKGRTVANILQTTWRISNIFLSFWTHVDCTAFETVCTPPHTHTQVRSLSSNLHSRCPQWLPVYPFAHEQESSAQLPPFIHLTLQDCTVREGKGFFRHSLFESKGTLRSHFWTYKFQMHMDFTH